MDWHLSFRDMAWVPGRFTRNKLLVFGQELQGITSRHSALSGLLSGVSIQGCISGK